MKTLPDKFWLKVDKTEGGCWNWTGYAGPGGYGRFYVKGSLRSRGAHRIAYEALKGPIPKGFQLDHLCRNTACVNPDHLEPVTAMVNVRRGMLGPKEGECRWGHVMDEANTYLDGKGNKRCRKCNVTNVLRHRVKHRTAFVCPFCSELHYTLPTLKAHMENGCTEYEETEAAPWMPFEHERSKAKESA